MKVFSKIACVALAGLISFSGVATGQSVKVTADVNDPVSLRINMMRNVGAATGLLAAMVKGEASFDATSALASLLVINTAALGMNSQFPEGFESSVVSTAAPALWQNSDGFSTAVAKFVADSTMAVEARPADLDSLRAVFGTVTGNCRACHQDFRIRQQ